MTTTATIMKIILFLNRRPYELLSNDTVNSINRLYKSNKTKNLEPNLHTEKFTGTQ